jgi:signal peptidase I
MVANKIKWCMKYSLLVILLTFFSQKLTAKNQYYSLEETIGEMKIVLGIFDNNTYLIKGYAAEGDIIVSTIFSFGRYTKRGGLLTLKDTISGMQILLNSKDSDIYTAFRGPGMFISKDFKKDSTAYVSVPDDNKFYMNSKIHDSLSKYVENLSLEKGNIDSGTYQAANWGFIIYGKPIRYSLHLSPNSSFVIRIDEHVFSKGTYATSGDLIVFKDDDMRIKYFGKISENGIESISMPVTSRPLIFNKINKE